MVLRDDKWTNGAVKFNIPQVSTGVYEYGSRVKNK